MSSYLIVHIEYKKKGSDKWEHLKFDGENELWFQGNVRDYFYHNGTTTNIDNMSESLKERYDQLKPYSPSLYVYTMNELYNMSRVAREEWFSRYKECLTNNYYTNKLYELLGKKDQIKDDMDLEYLTESEEYLREEEVWDWVGMEKLEAIIQSRLDMIPDYYREVSESRIVMWID